VQQFSDLSGGELHRTSRPFQAVGEDSRRVATHSDPNLLARAGAVRLAHLHVVAHMGAVASHHAALATLPVLIHVTVAFVTVHPAVTPVRAFAPSAPATAAMMAAHATNEEAEGERDQAEEKDLAPIGVHDDRGKMQT